jgi:hypothetical protein
MPAGSGVLVGPASQRTKATAGYRAPPISSPMPSKVGARRFSSELLAPDGSNATSLRLCYASPERNSRAARRPSIRKTDVGLQPNLGISRGTAVNHRTLAGLTIGARSAAALTHYAILHGWVQAGDALSAERIEAALYRIVEDASAS